MPYLREHTGARENAEWLENVVKEFCLESADNSLKNPESEKAWDKPLVGFSSGNDPLYQKLKEDIGPFYLTPLEIFQKSFPSVPVASAADLTVISWILPQTKATRTDNRKETVHPSDRWARSRYYGEIFNGILRSHVCRVLQDKGIEAVAPMEAPFWTRVTSERYGFASNWSERHAAFVSGLGTFGLCDGLITAVGKAVRCGSVIARITVTPTERPYSGHREYCLFFTKGKCNKCIERCPAGAVSEAGHDKNKCQDYLNKMAEYVKEKLGFETHPCGLCQTGVPCEFRIPGAGR